MLVSAKLYDVAGRFSLLKVILLGGDHFIDDLAEHTGRHTKALSVDPLAFFVGKKQPRVEQLRSCVPYVFRRFSQVFRQVRHIFYLALARFPDVNSTPEGAANQPQIVRLSTDSCAGGIA